MAGSQRPQQSSSAAHKLLCRAHSPATASRIHADKIKQKPLQLLPTTTVKNANNLDARISRRAAREAKTPRRSHKPRPLSAKERRALSVYDIPKSEIKYALYEGLHKRWCTYMQSVLGSEKGKDIGYVTPASAGQQLASADLHGAEVEVVRCSCVGRVGVKGIVVRDTKFTLVVVGKGDKVWVLPKQGTIFRMEVPFEADDAIASSDASSVDRGPTKTTAARQPFVFELHGSNLTNRAPDRATKKFKNHIPQNL